MEWNEMKSTSYAATLEIKIRTIRHFSIKYRTKHTSFVLESKKVEHAFNSFFQTKRRENFVILIVQVICVSNRFQISHIMNDRLQIIKSCLNEVKSFSKRFHNFHLLHYHECRCF